MLWLSPPAKCEQVSGGEQPFWQLLWGDGFHVVQLRKVPGLWGRPHRPLFTASNVDVAPSSLYLCDMLPSGLVSILNCSFDSGSWGSAVLVPDHPVVVDCCMLKTSMGLGRNLPTSKQRSHLLILLCLGGAGICNFNYFGFLLKQRAHFGSAASLPSLARCHCFSA